MTSLIIDPRLIATIVMVTNTKGGESMLPSPKNGGCTDISHERWLDSLFLGWWRRAAAKDGESVIVLPFFRNRERERERWWLHWHQPRAMVGQSLLGSMKASGCKGWWISDCIVLPNRPRRRVGWYRCPNVTAYGVVNQYPDEKLAGVRIQNPIGLQHPKGDSGGGKRRQLVTVV